MARAQPAAAPDAEALLRHATALHGAGNFVGAAAAYREVIRQQPDLVLAHYNLGVALHAAADADGAEAAFRATLRRAPDFVEAHNNLGNLLLARRRPERAEASFRHALKLRPDVADLHVNLALALRAQDRLAEAARALQQALALQPRHTLASRTLADLHWQQQRRAEALPLYAEAHRGDPDDVGIMRRLADCYMAERQLDQAGALYERVATLRPEEAQSHDHHAAWLFAQSQPEAALAACDRAAALEPDRVATLHNRGNALVSLGDLEAGRAAYEAALARDPHHAGVHFSLSLLDLSLGRLADGFRRYELRLLAPGTRDLGRPRWSGETLDGRTVLLQGEQGFGDTIQFARYAPLVAARGRTVLVVQPALDRLIRTLPGEVTVVSGDTQVPHFDVRCPLISLPHVFGTTPESIPADIPYLHADPADVAAWRARFAGLPGLRVGLVWSGNPDYPADRQRSLPPELLRPLLEVPGVSFVSLQTGAAAAALRGVEGVLDASPWLSDFADTAAAMIALDLVISVDTAAAHLAGALGRPVWLLNRADTDWRWLRGRADSPWYPTMRIFRQARRDDWASVVAEVAAALGDACGLRRAGQI